LAEEIDTAVVEKDKHLQAYVADARHIAYLSLGDEMRATHHRAVAISIRRELGEVSWQGLMAALRSAVTPLANSKKEIIELPDTLDVWLANRRRISLADLVPRFGEFISNDLEFYREVTDRFDKLVMRLKVGLNKPDNYLLLADPGSGKSFFVKEFARLLKERLNKHPDVTFLERNLSTYPSIEEAFTDIVEDVRNKLLGRQALLLFIDEADTQLQDAGWFERWIAPMNGDRFFFRQKHIWFFFFRRKHISFANQNLVIFYALSSKAEDLIQRQKWLDFLSRIPRAHQIGLSGCKTVH